MERQDQAREHIAGQAAEWFARLHDETPPAGVQDEFAGWLLRSPAHIEEYLAVTRLWGDVPGVGEIDLDELIRRSHLEEEAANVVTLTDGVAAAATAMHGVAGRASRRGYAYAAVALLGLAGLAGWLVQSQGSHPSRLVTAVGEQRSLALPDGSMVHLNTNSRLRIELSDSERRLVLERGEARFRVAREAQRPFLVITPQATVRAVGTEFNVQILGERTAVTVIEGRVALTESTQPPLELDAGEQAAVTQSGQVLPGKGPGVERVLAWTQRRLIFHEEPLSVVVAEFNRYHAAPLRIDDAALGAMKISGAFDAGDPDSLVQYLREYEQVEAQRLASGGRLLRRR